MKKFIGQFMVSVSVQIPLGFGMLPEYGLITFLAISVPVGLCATFGIPWMLGETND